MYHLIHPTFIHFSLAFLIFGGLCEAWGLLTGREASARFGGQLVVLGVVSLAFTILSGYVAANTIPLTVEGQRLLWVLHSAPRCPKRTWRQQQPRPASRTRQDFTPTPALHSRGMMTPSLEIAPHRLFVSP